MSLLSRAGDLVYTFRFIKLLTTPFDQTEAFKNGLIDKDGNRIKTKAARTAEEKSAYTAFHRLVFNIKKKVEKLPGSPIGSYASALYLMREEFGVSENKAIDKLGIDPLDFLEEDSQWYMLEDNRLSPGVYRIKGNKLLSESMEELAAAKDAIRVGKDAYPVGEIFGLMVYEAIHVKTNQKIHFTLSEIYK